jgi:hypothetical protein
MKIHQKWSAVLVSPIVHTNKVTGCISSNNWILPSSLFPLGNDDTKVLTQAAIDGQGIALCGLALVASHLAAGRLVRPFSHTLETDLASADFFGEGAASSGRRFQTSLKPVSCREQVQCALNLFDVDFEAIALWRSDHKAKILVIAIRQVLVVADETVRWLQCQQRTTRLEYIDAVYELASFDPYHGSRPGTGRHYGRDIGFRSVDDAKSPALTQMFRELKFIAHKAHFTAAPPENEHARVSVIAHV